MPQPPRTPRLSSSMRLAAVNGRIVMSEGMTATDKPPNGENDEPRPRTEAQAETQAIEWAKAFKESLRDEWDLTVLMATIEARLRQRHAQRRRPPEKPR